MLKCHFLMSRVSCIVLAYEIASVQYPPPPHAACPDVTRWKPPNSQPLPRKRCAGSDHRQAAFPARQPTPRGSGAALVAARGRPPSPGREALCRGGRRAPHRAQPAWRRHSNLPPSRHSPRARPALTPWLALRWALAPSYWRDFPSAPPLLLIGAASAGGLPGLRGGFRAPRLRPEAAAQRRCAGSPRPAGGSHVRERAPVASGEVGVPRRPAVARLGVPA